MWHWTSRCAAWHAETKHSAAQLCEREAHKSTRASENRHRHVNGRIFKMENIVGTKEELRKRQWSWLEYPSAPWFGYDNTQQLMYDKQQEEKKIANVVDYILETLDNFMASHQVRTQIHWSVFFANSISKLFLLTGYCDLAKKVYL